MTIYLPKTNYNYVLVMDIEFDKTQLIQFAGLLFKKIDTNIYQLSRSYNQYVSAKVSYPFINYTGITNTFLEENGVSLTDLIQGVLDDFLKNIPLDSLLIVSHGLKNDRKVLLDNRINLSYDNFSLKPIDGYCTMNNARRLMKRINHLKLDELAEECGFYLDGAHNAYHDAWATVSLLCLLKKKEQEEEIYENA